MTDGIQIPVETPSSQAPTPAPAPPQAPNPAPAPSVVPNPPAGNTKPPEAPKAHEPKPGELPVDANAPKPPDGEFKVPEQYKDKGWASKVKSLDDLYKQVDELDALKGRKSIVPDLKTATPEDKEAFYAQLRPKDAAEYQFTGDMASPDVKTAVGKMFMENGISAVQGNEIIKQYQALGEVEQAKMYDPAAFQSTMEASFGKDWQTTTGAAFNNLKSMMTPEDQKLMEHLPNAYATLIYRTLGNTDKAVQTMMQRYGVKETSLAHFAGTTGSAAGGDVTAVRAGLRAEMGKLGAGPHTADQMQALRQKLAATYENDPRIQTG